MDILRKQVPMGAQDFLPEECAAKKKLEQGLRAVFLNNGFEEIETPAFEYYDVFRAGMSPDMQEGTIKFFDAKGRILALRPDLTAPAARLAATKMPKSAVPKRLCYIGNAYGAREFNVGQRSEYTQAGVEYIGKAGSAADAELIALAAEALKSTGLTSFQIEIGQVGLFKGIMKAAGIGAEETEKIRALIDAKNTVELEYALYKLPMGQEEKEKLLALPGLFGGKEVLSTAREMWDIPACTAALKNLEEVFEALEDFGLSEYISIDLGMLHGLDYYSGILFRGIAEQIGFPVLSGGRYDTLMSDFGADAPAVGFAMGIKRILIALEREGNLPPREQSYALVTCQGPWRAQAYEYAQLLRAQGQNVIFEMQLTQEEIDAYRARGDIKKILCFSENAKMTEWTGGEKTC